VPGSTGPDRRRGEHHSRAEGLEHQEQQWGHDALIGVEAEVRDEKSAPEHAFDRGHGDAEAPIGGNLA
jgi:hypothetical protein